MPAWVENTMMRMLGSDFLFWAAIHVAREQVIKVVLATPPELLAAGKHLAPSPLETLHVPTLIVSARDDRYGTYASAVYTASRIAGAKFIGFDHGGHAWVGHDDEVMAAVVNLLNPGRPAR